MGNLNNNYWAFGIALMGFSSSIFFTQQANALEFGVCEVIVPKLINTNLSTSYWINKKIQGCCKGFIKVQDRCEPDCRNVTCINGRCIGNNTCECNEGYSPSPTSNRCRPICEPACIAPNAACQLPNVCQCRPRYKKFNSTYCEPICSFTEEEFECINAKCIAPNKCQCLDGYEAVSHFQCEPICQNCTNGLCIAPGQCECLDGYEKNHEGICIAICSPQCINGFCHAPNECTCFDNYEMYLNNYECLEQHVIQDHQNCRRSCFNGSCHANGTCLCNYGYENFNGKCLKICNKNCGVGKCLENQCICPPHYRLENSTCVPICAFEDDHDCINGECIGPNICRCFDGFKFLDNRNCTCVPMCNPSCINGICTENGCICHEGFYNISDYECGKNCSEGFVWLVDECIEEFSFDSEEFDAATMRSSTTEELFTSYEDESVEEVTVGTNSTSEEIDEGGITNDDISHENENEFMMTEEERKKLFYITFMVVLSAVFILLISILIAFYVLYQCIFPKQIYFVQEKELSSNCVFSSKNSNRKGILPVTEFNI